MTTILVVEDDRMIRHLMSRRLALAGYEVIVAEDGEEGVRRARTELPDLVIMDIGLPKINGWQATQRIRSMAATQHIPIIALTAFAMHDDRERCIAAGCSDYQTKPVNFTQLFEKMTALLAARQQQPTEPRRNR